MAPLVTCRTRPEISWATWTSGERRTPEEPSPGGKTGSGPSLDDEFPVSVFTTAPQVPIRNRHVAGGIRGDVVRGREKAEKERLCPPVQSSAGSADRPATSRSTRGSVVDVELRPGRGGWWRRRFRRRLGRHRRFLRPRPSGRRFDSAGALLGDVFPMSGDEPRGPRHEGHLRLLRRIRSSPWAAFPCSSAKGGPNDNSAVRARLYDIGRHRRKPRARRSTRSRPVFQFRSRHPPSRTTARSSSPGTSDSGLLHTTSRVPQGRRPCRRRPITVDPGNEALSSPSRWVTHSATAS